MVNLIDGSTLVLQHAPAPWADLVRESAALLEKKGVTDASYVDGIFDSIDKNGAYMLIAPRVLLAHTRPELGAIGTGMSLITTTSDVDFVDDASKPTRLFFTLAASDSDAHLELLAHLAEVLTDEDLFEELTTSTDADRVLQILNPA